MDVFEVVLNNGNLHSITQKSDTVIRLSQEG